MRLDKIIARSRIVDLRSADLEGALDELVRVSVGKFPDLKPEALLKGLLARESTMTTYLGFGVALPHVRVKMSRRYVLAIGRSRAGIRHDGAIADERVHLIVMLIAGEKARDYLQVLASIARQVREPELVESLINAPDLDSLFERLVGGFGGIRPVQAQQNRINRLMLREAERVARGAACRVMMVFGDTFIGGIEREALQSRLKTILVTRNPIEPSEDKDAFADTIQVRSFSSQRMAQLRSAILVALTRGVIAFNDRVCCIGGTTGSNQFDTLIVVDIEREFQTLLTGSTADLLPADVKPEVLERVIAVATELGVEGARGAPGGVPVRGRRHRQGHDPDQAPGPQSLPRVQGGGPQHPQPLHGRDGQGVLVDRRGLRDPGRRGGGVCREPRPGDDRQRPQPAERAGQPPRRSGRGERGGRLHFDRCFLKHRPGDALPARGDAAAHGEAPLGPPGLFRLQTGPALAFV